ncbi:unnamed protein product [Spirodela intermedia]|uniref:Uncharacterized protein n=1 Tax=Spirodela intermedia TaxID=51605 RepID=A0A7I8IDM9_SPIIN|nr:unnamed protein product [Spirodela intermedia]CAA6655927.1 unnamed protein product [Spirodela intermedia]
MTSAPDERESGGNKVPPDDSYESDYRRFRSFILKSAQQEEALHHICPCSRLLPD